MKSIGTITIVSLLLAAGCSHRESQAKNESSSSGYTGGSSTYSPSASSGSSSYGGTATSQSGSQSDSALTTQIRQDITRNPSFATFAPNIQVSVQSGTVTLSGSVPNEQDKQNIEAAIKRTSGVTTVNNQLQIPGQAQQSSQPIPAAGGTSGSAGEQPATSGSQSSQPTPQNSETTPQSSQ